MDFVEKVNEAERRIRPYIRETCSIPDRSRLAAR
jgi:hypothetical protein